MPGLIAGAMAGAGGALSQGAQMYGQYATHSALQQEMAQIMQARDERLSELRKGEISYGEQLKRAPYMEAAREVEQGKGAPVVDESGFDQRPRTAAESREFEKSTYKKHGLIGEALAMEGHDITREEGAATRGLHERLAKLTDQRIREEADLTRTQQLQLHRERMTELQNQAKNLGLSVQATDQGLVVVNATDKTATPLLDATGKPLKAAKQEDSLAVLKAIGDLAKSMETTNPKMAETLGNLAIEVLSGKMGRNVGPEPTPDDIEGLKQRAGNPQAVSFFESKFGKGSSAKFLPQGTPSPRPVAAAPGPAAAPTAPPVESAPGSPAAQHQARVKTTNEAKTKSVATTRSKFDQDATTMTGQDLYDSYDDKVGDLTPAQRAVYQRRIREVK